MAFDFGQIFYDDYYQAKWRVVPSQTPRSISWSTTEERLVLPLGETVETFQGVSQYENMLNQAFELWDQALDSISFVRTNAGNAADVTVALTYIDGPGGDYGYWNSKWDNSRHISKATIRLEPGDFENNALTTALHEIGNILGLGDIHPSASIRSVQEDPFPESFQGTELWVDDITMVKQLYGESRSPGDSGATEDEIIGTLIASRSTYGTSTADTITGYNPKTDNPIQIDLDSFPSAAGKLKIARKSSQVAKLAKKDLDFIYDRQAGYLYYNENGKEAGFGDGGVLAILEGKPKIGMGNFEFV